MPPDERSGPPDAVPGDRPNAVDDQPATRTETSVRHPYVVAVELLGDQAERERTIFETAWTAGFRDGFERGVEVGERREAERAFDDWAHMAENVRGYSRSPSHAELELRRCGGRREDFGRPRPGDFPGESARGAA